MILESSIRQALLKAAAFLIASALFIFFALSTVSSSRAVADTTGTQDSLRTGTTNYAVANPQNCPKYTMPVLASDAGVKQKFVAQEGAAPSVPGTSPGDASGGARSE